MQQMNTFNDLVLFAYSEPDLAEAESFQRFINNNRELSIEFKAILRVKSLLNKLQVGPSESVIKNILGYSSALSVSKSKNAGNISLLLN